MPVARRWATASLSVAASGLALYGSLPLLIPAASLLIVADAEHTLILSGTGDVIEPEDGIAAIGSGGPYAQAAARALIENTDMKAADIVGKAMEIAADICIYTNKNVTLEELNG